MPVRHIVFDCDGVLVDSELILSDLEVGLARRIGVTMPPAEMHRRFLGRTAFDQWTELAREYRVELPADFHAVRVREAKEALSARLKPVAGVPETLARIDQKMTCASNSDKEMLEHKLKVAGILHHFGDRTISYEEVARPKPAPDMYCEAVARSGLPVSGTVVVEDTKTGASAAIAAGIRVIGFIGGDHATPEMAEELKEAGAFTLVDDFRRLPDLITGL
ncbi:MAG: HAD family phosphatase [Pseudomonadota bacterium]|nr:HAD family phosphatase [Pseudomonadota bacterium]